MTFLELRNVLKHSCSIAYNYAGIKLHEKTVTMDIVVFPSPGIPNPEFSFSNSPKIKQLKKDIAYSLKSKFH